MHNYLVLLQDVLNNGDYTQNRTGVNTYSLFGYQLKYDLSQGFPLVTTKKMFWKGIVHEWLWLISGSTNINDLHESVRHWWTPWADQKGDLGPIYGYQLRKWPTQELCDSLPIIEKYDFDGTPVLGIRFLDNVLNELVFEYKPIDQLIVLIDRIKTNPNCRRLILTAWNPADIEKMKLPPCHMNHVQFYVANGKLSCCMTQRSADAFIGLPVNIAQYALLTHMISHLCDLDVGNLIIQLKNVHIYENHITQVHEQLNRTPLNLPILSINRQVNYIDDFKFEDFELINYTPYSALKAPIAI